MTASLTLLPLELLLFICSHLQVPDIQNTRLTCRLLNEAASPYLIDRVWLSSDPRDQELLTAISKCSIIGKHVREITYDATIYESTLVGRNGKPGRYVACGEENPGHWSKTTLQGFHRYWQHYQEWHSLQRYRGDHQTRTNARLPANFNSLVMGLRDTRTVARSKLLTQLAQYLPTDLICLLHALLLMPNITTFSVSDQRWTLKARDRKPKNRDYTGAPRLGDGLSGSSPLTHWQTLEGGQTLIIEPRQWPYHLEDPEAIRYSREWYRGFFVLTQAASMLYLRNLQSFRIDSSDDHGIRGITHEVFQLTPMELMHTCNAFRRLTHIALQLNPIDHSPERLFDHTMERGNIAFVLGSAHSLTNLELSFSVLPTRTIDTGEIFGIHIWQRLRSVSLMNIVFNGLQFNELFDRHIGSLQSIYLENVVLWAQYPPEYSELYEAPWPTAYRVLGRANLDHLRIKVPLGYSYLGIDERFWPCNWSSKDAASIRRFLAGSGREHVLKTAEDTSPDAAAQRVWAQPKP